MKKIIFALLICITTTLQGQIIEIETAKKAGLASYLTTVKTLAEFKMLTLAKDSAQYRSKQNADKVRGFNAKYNLVKLYTDQLINQLSADSYNSNKLKAYRMVNNFLKEGKSLPSQYGYYSNLLTNLDGVLETFLMMHYGSAAAGASLEEYTGIAGAIVGIITSDRDFREKKIQSITALLKELKLKSIADLKPSEIKKD